MKTLCATDFSQGAHEVLLAAAAMARALKGPLEVVHVVEAPGGPTGAAELALVGGLREAAEKELGRRIEALRGTGVPVSGWVEIGRADEAILAAATTRHPALLVLGTHGRGPLLRSLLGSVAERILRQAPCPVLVLPPGRAAALGAWRSDDRPLRLTVGIDFSATSDAILNWLRSTCDGVPCALNLVHAFWPPEESRRLGLPVASGDRPDSEMARVLERELRARVGEFGRPGAAVLKVVPNWGDAIHPLGVAAQAASADLLVLGTSVGGGAASAIEQLREGQIPVLCVPAAVARSRAMDQFPHPRHVAFFTDLSEVSNAALSEAVWALQGGGVLTLGHVTAGTEPGQVEQAERQLRQLGAPLADNPRIELRILVHVGLSAAEGIVQAIGRIGPDLVVICSHGSGRGNPAVLGSTAEVVARLSPVPVVIFPAARLSGGASLARR